LVASATARASASACCALSKQAVGHLQRELGRRLLRRLRRSVEELQAPPRETRRLVVRIQARGGLRRLVPVFGRADPVARRFEQQRDVAGAVAGL
jgi:hypothetical protein